MNIALIGYGKMGKAIEEIATNRGHHIISRVNSGNSENEWIAVRDADVCIEFTRPEAAVQNITRCLQYGKSVVSGTTGWQTELNSLNELCRNLNGTLLWSSNFSIGVNLFWEVNKRLAELMNAYPDYNVSMEEIHHTHKKDAPSGTAVTTAGHIIDKLNRYKGWVLGHSTTEANTIPINALRIDDVKGTHTVRYENAIDLIELRHEAKSREGFALGAVTAAEYVFNKKGIFSMKDVLGI